MTAGLDHERKNKMATLRDHLYRHGLKDLFPHLNPYYGDQYCHINMTLDAPELPLYCQTIRVDDSPQTRYRLGRNLIRAVDLREW